MKEYKLRFTVTSPNTQQQQPLIFSINDVDKPTGENKAGFFFFFAFPSAEN